MDEGLRRRGAVMKISTKAQIWTSVVVLMCGTIIGVAEIPKTSHAGAKAEAPILAPPIKNAPTALASSYSPVIKKVLPEVVNISSSRVVRHPDEERSEERR